MSDKKYTKDHEWITIENGVATVGISNHAQESLGDIVFIELPTIGKSVNAKDEICVIESVKAASDIYAPIDGVILEINNNLESDAAIINKDAENSGWIFKMKVSNPIQYDELMSEDDYNKFLEK
ncbi:MAG: glycine cleavage system protein H [Pelagibacteraceae bacterium TMED237]|nr:MAG: glycine cleavage system protein H [Pelagibacteraceae bacterium TMED237]